jgi:purine-binding chemotaxis protein CheW
MMTEQPIQFCTFYVENLFLGIDVQQVQEVIRYQEMTRVPLAAPAISGLINLRGQIVTAIDLRVRLGLPARPAGEQPMNVVVRDGDAAVSLLVDRIGDVLEVNDAEFERPPSTIRPSMRGLILGAYKLPEELLLVLDTAQTVTENELRSAETRLAV